MEKRLVVGISSHYVYSKKQLYYFLYTSYAKAVSDCGHVPIIIPFLEDEELLQRFLDLVDVVMVSGGGPGLTPEMRSWSLEDQNPRRHAFETRLVASCLDRNIPLIGICRGFQTIAQTVGADLSLRLDSPIVHRQKGSHSEPSHDIVVVAGSLLSSALQTERVAVNSIHSQGFFSLPSALRPTAFAPDGVIEAYESADGFSPVVLGLQFHPEKMYAARPVFLNIFMSFFAAVLQK